MDLSTEGLGSERPPSSTNPALDVRLFHWVDYLVFAICLAIPVCIGVFFWIRSLAQQSTEEFLLGGRSMNFVAVALSLLASILNGVFVIGIPAEIHYGGIRISYQFLAGVLAGVIVAPIFVAKYQKMGFTSAYQYVQWRYDMPTRVIASAFFCVSVTIFLAVVLYVPALAFSQVTNVNIYVTIVVTGFVCTLYTTIGGLKAVVWTDALQMVILVVGLVVVAIVGAVDYGGGNKVWRTVVEDGRNNFINFSPDPRERTSFWSITLGVAVTNIGIYISNQMAIQRYMSVESSAKAVGSLYIAILMSLPLYILISVIGFVVHATYHKCDPLLTGRIKQADQIFPLFLMDVLGDYYGIPGLIMSSIFAAALSSVSSIINALSACILEDYIDPALLHFKNKKLSDKTRRWIAVIIVLIFGVLTVALSSVASKFTTKLVQATTTIWGVFGGPLAGIFIMGFLFPFVNSWGAISGMFGGLFLALWVSVGNIVHAPGPVPLPLGNCSGGFIVPPSVQSDVPLIEFYLISFGWYGVIGTGVCMVVGILVSLATGGLKKSYRESMDPKLMYSVADNCCCCCPLSCIVCYRCGVKFENDPSIGSNKVMPIEDSSTTSSSTLSINKQANGEPSNDVTVVAAASGELKVSYI